MLKIRALLGLLLIAMVVATVAVWQLRGSTEPPLSTETGEPSNPTGEVDAATAGSNDGQATGTIAVDASVHGRADTGPVRVEVGASAGTDRRPCRLEVTVLVDTMLADHQGTRNPVPFTEVATVLADLGLASALGRTDARGIAEYTFFGGNGLTVRCLAGVGGQHEATLQAETTVRATIVIKPKVFATGRVIDQSNVGIGDADIVLLRWPHDQHSLGSMWRIGRSERNGSFRIPVRVGGQIGAMHANYVSSAMFMLRPNRDASQPPPTQVFNLVLRQDAATIVGVVHTLAGQPIGNAEIEVRSARAAPAGAELVGPPHRTHSDRNGNFRITGLQAGEVQWSACASNHGWLEAHASLNTSGDNYLEIEFPLPTAVEGVVVNKATGKAIAGATVSAGKPGTLCYRMTKSGPDGSYLLDDLGSGPTPVRAEFEQQVATAERILLADYIDTWHPELVLDGSTKLLEGVVLDTNKEPLAGWSVIVRQTDRDPTGTTSDESGHFAIPVVQTKGLDVRCYAPGRQPTSFADARQRNAQIGTDVVLLTGQVHRTTIVGRVIGSGARGVPATIGCWHHQHREYARHSADGDGRFTITDVPIGTVNLTIEHTDHVAYETGNLKLQTAVPVDLGTVQLSLGGGLYGTVLGPAGSAPLQCELTLEIAAPYQVIAAEYVGGSYRFGQVPPGKHTLIVRSEGLAAASFPITIEAGVDLPRDIELQTGSFLIVRVLVPLGGGDKVTLAIRIKGKETRWIATSQVQRDGPDAAGVAQFKTWMVAGQYEIAAVTPQGYEARGTVIYPSDGASPYRMQLAPRKQKRKRK